MTPTREKILRAWRGGDGRFQHYISDGAMFAAGPYDTPRCMRCGQPDGDFPCITRAPTFSASRAALNLPACEDCHAERLVPHDGDVAMCLACGQWYQRGACGPARIGPHTAAMAARAPMDRDDVIAARDKAAEDLERTRV